MRRFKRARVGVFQRIGNFLGRMGRFFKGFNYGGGGSASGGSVNGWAELFGLNGLLPGSEFDYRREAGNLWENGVVLSLIKFVCRVYPDAIQCISQPGESDKPKLLFKHPLLDLLKRPSPDFDKSVLDAGIILSLSVDGNAYLFKIRNDFGKVVGLHYVPHFLVNPYWPRDGSEFITGYVYRVDGKTYLIKNEDVVHLRDGTDPMNTRKGLAPFSAVLREVCSDNESSTYSAALMRNCGIPPVTFSPKQDLIDPLTAKQIEDFKARYMETVRAENAGEPFINGIPVDMHAPAFSPEQMVLDKIRSIPAERICSAFGLDPMVIALPSSNKTYSNYQEARAGAHELCIMPMQRNIDSQMTRQLMDDILLAGPDDVLARDYSQVRYLQEDQDKLHKRWRDNFIAGGVTRAIFLERIGEKFDPAKDDVYIQDIELAQQTALADQQAEHDQNAADNADNEKKSL